MRPFEVVLILATLLMIVLPFARPPRFARLAVAGGDLAALVAHGTLEGVRWQLAAAYALAVVLVMYALVRGLGDPRGRRPPRALGIIAAALGVVILAGTAFLAAALPVFALPAPTGEYAVGVTSLRLVDARRADPFLADGARRRELMVKLYYPAEPNDAVPYARYFDGSTALLGAYARFYGLPSFAFGHLALVRTHAKRDPVPSPRERDYPVVLFSHGAGATPEVETAQAEDLASHGYIVAAIDHTYVSAATLFPDRLVTAGEATTNFNVPEPAAAITQIMADDDRFVIEQLGALDAGGLYPALAGKLDLDAIGVIGHSVGGATAYNLALSDDRVKAAINLDGAVYVTPGDARAIAPFLMLANDRYHARAVQDREPLMARLDDTPEGQRMMRDLYGSTEVYDEQYQRALADSRGLADVLAQSGTLYTIAGSDHMKFTDIGLFIGNGWLRGVLQIQGATDPARCLTITAALTVAFFDHHLKGAAPSLGAVVAAYPELRNVPLR